MTKRSLLTDISVINKNLAPSSCGFKTVYDALNTEDQADLKTAITDIGIACSAIERALRQRGYTVSASTMRRHRRKDCSCGRIN
jgi:D-arabinose 1-dehydrogenase-like Zn-dependent alcohol dehydrogenase